MTEKFGRCRAQVELAGREDAVSSWVAVTSSLDQLSALCRRTSSQEDRTGGWLLMGPEERIKVSLLGPDDSGFDFEGTGDVLKLNGTDFE